jgi:hypothetical protein
LKNDDFFSTKALGRDERAESSSREWPLWQPTKIIQNRASQFRQTALRQKRQFKHIFKIDPGTLNNFFV